MLSAVCFPKSFTFVTVRFIQESCAADRWPVLRRRISILTLGPASEYNWLILYFENFYWQAAARVGVLRDSVMSSCHCESDFILDLPHQ